MSREVLSANASLHHLSVTLEVVRVGKKQMTQSVFRQLPTKNFIDITKMDDDHYFMESLGREWGVVKYSIGSYHRHLLWEGDGVLYRWPIPSTTFDSDVIPWFVRKLTHTNYVLISGSSALQCRRVLSSRGEYNGSRDIVRRILGDVVCRYKEPSMQLYISV